MFALPDIIVGEEIQRWLIHNFAFKKLPSSPVDETYK